MKRIKKNFNILYCYIYFTVKKRDVFQVLERHAWQNAFLKDLYTSQRGRERTYKFSKENALRKRRGRSLSPYSQQGELSSLFLICMCQESQKKQSKKNIKRSPGLGRKYLQAIHLIIG